MISPRYPESNLIYCSEMPWYPESNPIYCSENWDDPSASIVSIAQILISSALFLIFHLLHSSTISQHSEPVLSPVTPTFSSSPHLTGISTPTRTTIFKIFTTSFSFKNYSVNIGHVIVGTPEHAPSIVEFNPQWVKNPPMAGCDKIRTCGAQPLIRSPLPLILSSDLSSSNHFSSSWKLSPVLITQIKDDSMLLIQARVRLTVLEPGGIDCPDRRRVLISDSSNQAISNTLFPRSKPCFLLIAFSYSSMKPPSIPGNVFTTTLKNSIQLLAFGPEYHPSQATNAPFFLKKKTNASGNWAFLISTLTGNPRSERLWIRFDR